MVVRMSTAEDVSNLAGELLDTNVRVGVRKGLLHRGSEWFHLSQKNGTVKLRPLGLEAVDEDNLIKRHLDDPEHAEWFRREFATARFYGGWSITDAVEGRDQIEAGTTIHTPTQGRRDPVPRTRLRHFYELVRTFGDHAVCEALLSASLRRTGDQLGALFIESVAHFQIYDNIDDDFGDRGRARKDWPDRDDFASSLVREIATRKEWAGDPALAFDYVSREVSPLRTRESHFDDLRPARSSGAGGMDLLLRAKDGGLPIIGEVKAQNDTNLFVALVQSLTYACELVTQAQRTRLARHDYGFSPTWAQASSGPFVDIYIFFEEGTDEGIRRGTRKLAAYLLQQPSSPTSPALSSYVRRIEFLCCPPRGGAADLRVDRTPT